VIVKLATIDAFISSLHWQHVACRRTAHGAHLCDRLVLLFIRNITSRDCIDIPRANLWIRGRKAAIQEQLGAPTEISQYTVTSSATLGTSGQIQARPSRDSRTISSGPHSSHRINGEWPHSVAIGSLNKLDWMMELVVWLGIYSKESLEQLVSLQHGAGTCYPPRTDGGAKSFESSNSIALESVVILSFGQQAVVQKRTRISSVAGKNASEWLTTTYNLYYPRTRLSCGSILIYHQ
jgi:hypothetical protein